MSKEFFYSIASKNISGGNNFQNGIAVKPVLHHAKIWGICEFVGLSEKAPSNDCKQRLKYGC